MLTIDPAKRLADALGLMGIGLVTAIVANSMALALMWYIRSNRAYAAYPLSSGLLRLNTCNVSI